VLKTKSGSRWFQRRPVALGKGAEFTKFTVIKQLVWTKEENALGTVLESLLNPQCLHEEPGRTNIQ
jgi:hypothetical protein